MELTVFGVNHRDWPAGRVERFGERFEAAFLALVDAVRRHRARGTGHAAEAVLLSTCNRFETVCYGDARFCASLRSVLREAGVPGRRIATRSGREAVAHVLRVAAGMESVFPGEVMVMSQVKGAYARALAAGTSGPVTNRLFQRSLRACRAARERIDGTGDPRLLAGHALRRVAALFPLESCPCALIGAGPALASFQKALEAAGAGPVARVVRDHRGEDPQVCNLTRGRALFPRTRLFVLDATTLRHDLRLRELTAARDRFGEVAVLDYSLARGVDPACRDLEGVYHFSRDELDPLDRAAGPREDANARAEETCGLATDEFMAWLSARERERALERLLEGAAAHAEAAFAGTGVPEEAVRDFVRRVGGDLRRRLRRMLDPAPRDPSGAPAAGEEPDGTGPEPDGEA